MTGMPEEELSAIEFSHNSGLVLMDDDTWLSREDAILAVGVDMVAELRARTRGFLERAGAQVDDEQP